MPQSPSLKALITKLRQGDNEAAREVYQRFAHRLIGLAHQKMGTKLQRKIDPEDVAQSVLKSVILRLGEGQFDIGDWDGLWGLLVQFTLHRCMRWAEHYQAGMRDLDREADSAGGSKSGSVSDWKFLDREPSPDEAAILAETVEHVLKALKDRERQIASMSLEGYDVREISASLGCTQSKVYRVLARMRQLLERMETG
jgi:RNA polymerase sigma-70 factor, ECF subfamily